MPVLDQKAVVRVRLCRLILVQAVELHPVNRGRLPTREPTRSY